MFNLKIFIRKSIYRHKIKFCFYLLKSILNPFGKYFWISDYCNSCQTKSFKIYYPLKQNSDLGLSYNESGICFSCGSSHRNRVIWDQIKKHINGDLYLPTGDGFLYHRLRDYPSIKFSDYYIDSSDVLHNIPHQDLTNLTYADNSYDLIISEHIMEHVHDPKKAFNEIFRVLKKNGMYIFSIPFENKTKSLTRIDNNYTEFMPRKYHLDPLRNEGALVFNDFSKKDFLEKYVPSTFKSKEIIEDVSIVKGVKVISEVVILQK
jgi:hypothetical protein